MQEQRHKDTKHPEKAQRMDYPSRNNPGSQSLPLINKYSSSNSLSFCFYALFARRTNVSPLVYGNIISKSRNKLQIISLQVYKSLLLINKNYQILLLDNGNYA
ncbi:hypothetical protein EDEG_01538 [Edhazardia aedis USNM 41457]|uniref:Uncharacterized protein n=1 Tax=Edhazardia aedis (strain USNM 41457) TaxID=1003232 RepID=J8ZWW7_EDHAE|nr:hypothetical protein EDEG_01538 [Edhazardia aedis USNM 41457]|eukprot:EJW04163.1 hypothetical protein EDEG_01538 [Edhazardia aedis USNM 41457]